MLVSSYDLAIKKLSELEKTTIVPNFEFTVSKFDYQEMYVISKKCIKNVQDFIQELIKSNDIINNKYTELKCEIEKIYILMAVSELREFIKMEKDDDQKLNDLITKYPFLCLKIIGASWENEYFDLYLYFLNRDKFKKCTIMLKNKGLDENILKNKSPAYINIIEESNNLHNSILSPIYFNKMKSLIFNIEEHLIDDYLSSLVKKETIDFNFSFDHFNIEDNIKSSFWIHLSNDLLKIVKSLYNVRKLNKTNYYDDLINCSNLIYSFNLINQANATINDIDKILDFKFNKYLNDSWYEIYIKNGIKKICNLLFTKNIDKNKLFELKEDYPELFKDYVIHSAIEIKKINYIEYWSISNFINKKYCSEFLKKYTINNDIKMMTDFNFEKKLTDYYNCKKILLDDINDIFISDNSKDRMHLEYKNLIYNFQYDFDNEKIQKLIENIRLYY
jgi:hypothetical protein